MCHISLYAPGTVLSITTCSCTVHPEGWDKDREYERKTNSIGLSAANDPLSKSMNRPQKPQMPEHPWKQGVCPHQLPQWVDMPSAQTTAGTNKGEGNQARKRGDQERFEKQHSDTAAGSRQGIRGKDVQLRFKQGLWLGQDGVPNVHFWSGL